VKRSVSEIAAFAATIIVAAAIGFGIPLLWVWVGSQVQGGTGSASNLDFSVAMLILFGIIVSYVIVLYLAGWVMTRFGGEPIEGPQRGSANSPWMRGMTDSRAIQPGHPSRIDRIERTFVITTIIVTVAVSIWFFGFAGSPLPAQ
jgi:NADH:ubiquinone oxidoreductase subunit 5 (subunit L)/multisubunit Na+/H+ antiporter MnhA subunit